MRYGKQSYIILTIDRNVFFSHCFVKKKNEIATHFFWFTVQQGINEAVMMAQTSDQTIQLPTINNLLCRDKNRSSNKSNARQSPFQLRFIHFIHLLIKISSHITMIIIIVNITNSTIHFNWLYLKFSKATKKSTAQLHLPALHCALSYAPSPCQTKKSVALMH